MMRPTDEQLKDPKWWDENAPGFATHYDTHVGAFMTTGLPGSDNIPRPTKPAAPEWDGVSPLPIDLLLEVSVYSQQWRRAKIKAINGEQCWLYVFDAGDIVEPIKECSFRPLRTKAQRERDELIKIIGGRSIMSYSFEIADDIIAAGWRKEKQDD